MTLQSENINEIMTALAKAQGKMEAAVKDSTNPHFKSKYADLASVWEACRKALSDNGLAITQTLDFVGDKQVLVTTLGHSSGQWIKSTIALPIQKNGPQELGSCLSYCRRYALAAMVGVYQDDDDANKAQAPYNKPKEEEKPKGRTCISEEEYAQLDSLYESIQDDEYKKGLLQFLKITYIYEVEPKDYERAMKSLANKLKSQEEANAKSSVA